MKVKSAMGAGTGQDDPTEGVLMVVARKPRPAADVSASARSRSVGNPSLNPRAVLNQTDDRSAEGSCLIRRAAAIGLSCRLIVTAVGRWPTARVLAKPRDGWRLRAGTCWRTATFLDSSFLSAPTRRHSCASEPTSGLDPLDRILRTRQRQFRLRLFLQHFRGALPDRCGLLAEVLDRVMAKEVRSCRIIPRIKRRPKSD